MKTTKVALGYPWYAGPDEDTFELYQEILFYFGRLEERSIWFKKMAEAGLGEQLKEVRLPPLDMAGNDPEAEIMPEDGEFQFFQAVETRCSLPGLARERIADMALQVGADWLFCWDADMRFPYSTFLKLWRHQKPIVNALAFTSREPIQPCVYKIHHGIDPQSGEPMSSSETVLDIPFDKPLITDEDIGGQLAFGAGVVLVNTNVFRQIKKPWYHSTGCGEDWMFCLRAAAAGVSRYVDTSFNIRHKKHQPQWHDKELYLKMREEHPEIYEALKNREGMA